MPMPTQPLARLNSSKPTAAIDTKPSDLASLLPMWPREIEDMSVRGRERRILLLRKALRSERRLGLAGHWTYDLARHSALLACYRREVVALAAMLDEPRVAARGG